jgi:hypothetical protein
MKIVFFPGSTELGTFVFIQRKQIPNESMLFGFFLPGNVAASFESHSNEESLDFF